MECEIMVSNEEIKRMLENRRRGIKTEPKKEVPSPVPPSTSRKPVSPSTRTCESCGAQNPPDAKFCIKCGQTLKAPEKEEEKKTDETPLDALPRSGMDGIDYRTCPNCSHQNKPQAKFCVVCGQKLEETPSEEPGTGSLLDQVQDTHPEEETTPDQPVEEETPAAADLIDEESTEEESEKRSLLSRRVPEEETSTVEIPEEDLTEEVSEEKTITGEIPEEDISEAPVEEASPEEVPEEEEELPHVKTLKFDEGSLKTEYSPSAIAEEVPEVETEEVSEEIEETTETSPEKAPSKVDPMEKIRKAKELLDIGAITEEEFEEIKKKYLAMI
jgi:ribosomal protein L40E